MDHPDWPALMGAIVADPDDDTVRLVAADFLEENGDPDRAAFIRIQCALARLETSGGAKSLEADDLRKKERAFLGPLSMFRLLWAAEACPELVRLGAQMHVEGAERLAWRRGFVERVTCPVAEWLRHGTAVRVRQPVRDVMLTPPSVTREEWYARLTALRGLRSVRIDRWHDSGGFVLWLREWLSGTKVDEIPF